MHLTLCVAWQVLDTGGTLVDGLSLTAYAALNNTRLPKLHVINVGVRDGGELADAATGEGKLASDEQEFDIEVDDDPGHAVALEAADVPVCITFAQVGGRSIVDARQSEELCSSSRMMVFVGRSGQICAVETSGTGSISTASLHKSLSDAVAIAASLIARVDKALVADRARTEREEADEVMKLAAKRLVGADGDSDEDVAFEGAAGLA